MGNLLALDDDLRGDMGFVPDASWSARWTRFSNEQHEAHWADVACWTFFNLVQMEHLIQGLPPPPYSWSLPTDSCLIAQVPTVTRLREDIRRGLLSAAPTPADFADWCAKWGVNLPPEFTLLNRMRPAVSQQSTPPTCAWAPLSQPTKTGAPRRGRPPKAAARNEHLISDGTELLMKAASTGVFKPAREIAKELCRTTFGQGLTFESIERILRNKLPLDVARATATANQHAIQAKLNRRTRST